MTQGVITPVLNGMAAECEEKEKTRDEDDSKSEKAKGKGKAGKVALMSKDVITIKGDKKLKTKPVKVQDVSNACGILYLHI